MKWPALGTRGSAPGRKAWFLRLLALSLLLLPAALPARALGEKACLNRALALLQQADRAGYAIVQQARDRDFFSRWLLCDTGTFGLGLAVHETSHKLDLDLADHQRHAYYIGPGEVLRVRYYNLFQRSEILEYLPAAERSMYARQYLEGAMGQQDITMVLEELNAYTHGTVTDSQLVRFMAENERQSTRDGLVTFMYYTELYLRRGREHHPGHWRKIAADPDYLKAIQRLWQRAEEVLKPILAEPRLGMNDRPVLAKVYSPELVGELKQLFQAGKRAFRTDPELWEMAKRIPDAQPPAHQEVTTPVGPSPVEVITPSRRPPQPQITITINGRPATLPEMEEMLRENPGLKDNGPFMQLLQMMREREKKEK